MAVYLPVGGGSGIGSLRSRTPQTIQQALPHPVGSTEIQVRHVLGFHLFQRGKAERGGIVQPQQLLKLRKHICAVGAPRKRVREFPHRMAVGKLCIPAQRMTRPAAERAGTFYPR